MLTSELCLSETCCMSSCWRNRAPDSNPGAAPDGSGTIFLPSEELCTVKGRVGDTSITGAAKSTNADTGCMIWSLGLSSVTGGVGVTNFQFATYGSARKVFSTLETGTLVTKAGHSNSCTFSWKIVMPGVMVSNIWSRNRNRSWHKLNSNVFGNTAAWKAHLADWRCWRMWAKTQELWIGLANCPTAHKTSRWSRSSLNFTGNPTARATSEGLTCLYADISGMSCNTKAPWSPFDCSLECPNALRHPHRHSKHWEPQACKAVCRGWCMLITCASSPFPYFWNMFSSTFCSDNCCTWAGGNLAGCGNKSLMIGSCKSLGNTETVICPMILCDKTIHHLRRLLGHKSASSRICSALLNPVVEMNFWISRCTKGEVAADATHSSITNGAWSFHAAWSVPGSEDERLSSPSFRSPSCENGWHENPLAMALGLGWASQILHKVSRSLMSPTICVAFVWSPARPKMLSCLSLTVTTVHPA